MFDAPREYDEFVGFSKMGRLSRECVITEKIDGTNAQVYITDAGRLLAGSRTRWITPGSDNFAFAAWCEEHRDELMGLGPGRHFGEWWGSGIQRGYGLPKGEKRFSLFNVIRWCLSDAEPGVIKQGNPDVVKMQERLPACVGLVPELYRGLFDTLTVDVALSRLRANGSYASPGFMDPEGVIVFHIAANVGFKRTLDGDDLPKSLAARRAA